MPQHPPLKPRLPVTGHPQTPPIIQPPPPPKPPTPAAMPIPPAQSTSTATALPQGSRDWGDDVFITHAFNMVVERIGHIPKAGFSQHTWNLFQLAKVAYHPVEWIEGPSDFSEAAQLREDSLAAAAATTDDKRRRLEEEIRRLVEVVEDTKNLGRTGEVNGVKEGCQLPGKGYRGSGSDDQPNPSSATTGQPRDHPDPHRYHRSATRPPRP